MGRSPAGVTSLFLGVVVGIGGLFLYGRSECRFGVGDICFELVRPFDTLGLLVIGFGMALFVLGIVLIALAGPEED